MYLATYILEPDDTLYPSVMFQSWTKLSNVTTLVIFYTLIVLFHFSCTKHIHKNQTKGPTTLPDTLQNQTKISLELIRKNLHTNASVTNDKVPFSDDFTVTNQSAVPFPKAPNSMENLTL